MKLQFRLLFGLLSLAAVGAVVYVHASSNKTVSAPVPAVNATSGDSCCGPDPASVLPNFYQAKPETPAAPAAPAKN